MKAVILDGYALNPGDLDWKSITAIDDIRIYDRTPISKIKERINDAEIVLTNKTPLTRKMLYMCPNIKYIGVLATGYDVIDIDAAKERNIVVCNVPDYGIYRVSQFAIALLLEICSHVGHHEKEVRKGTWIKKNEWCFWDYPLIELYGKTMGIIGYGRIGQNTGRIAKSLGMKVIVNDIYKNSELKDVHYVDFDTLCKNSDVIVLHCSLNSENYHIINKEALSKMKKSAIIINNARGGLINESDLAEALNNELIYAAALDVVSSEPIKENNPLLTAKNCMITPHMSWGAKEARQRIMKTTNDNILAFLRGNPINQVN